MTIYLTLPALLIVAAIVVYAYLALLGDREQRLEQAEEFERQLLESENDAICTIRSFCPAKFRRSD